MSVACATGSLTLSDRWDALQLNESPTRKTMTTQDQKSAGSKKRRTQETQDPKSAGPRRRRAQTAQDPKVPGGRRDGAEGLAPFGLSLLPFGSRVVRALRSLGPASFGSCALRVLRSSVLPLFGGHLRSHHTLQLGHAAARHLRRARWLREDSRASTAFRASARPAQRQRRRDPCRTARRLAAG